MSAYDTFKAGVLGNPYDASKKPSRTLTVQAFSEMQKQLEGAQSGALVKDTLSDLQNLNSVSEASIMAWVLNDTIQNNNGIYENTGTASSPSWTRRSDIPVYVISCSNVGGTANAIVAETDLPIPVEDGRCMIILSVLQNNTDDVTVSFNNGLNLPILTSSGNQIVANGLQQSMNVAGFISGGNFRLLSDISSSAIQTASENAANRAEAAAAVFDSNFDDVITITGNAPTLNFVDDDGSTQNNFNLGTNPRTDDGSARNWGNFGIQRMLDNGTFKTAINVSPDGLVSFPEGIDSLNVKNGPTSRNYYFGAFFTRQDDLKINLVASMDGENFTTFNTTTFDLGSNDEFANRDPAPTFFNGEFWYFCTGGSDGVADFVVYKGKNIFPDRKDQVSLGGGPYRSATLPFPDGIAVSPASSIWAPEPMILNETLFIAIAMRYGPDYTNEYGNTGAQDMKMFISECTDPENLIFSVPVLMDFGADNSLSLIDASIIVEGNDFWCAVKDDDLKNIRIYSKAVSEGLTGGVWIYNQTIGSSEYSLEAPCFVPYYYQSLGSDVVQTEWRLYCDYNRSGPAATEIPPDKLIGWPVYFQTDTPNDPGGNYGNWKTVKFKHPVRHGSLFNLADFPFEAALAVSLAHVTEPRHARLDRELLTSGNVTIEPQPGTTYYVSGTDTVVNLTINNGPADEFFLQVGSASVGTGIIIPDTDFVAGPMYLGFGHKNDTITKMVRSAADDGQYYPEGYVHPPNFLSVQEVEISAGVIVVGFAEIVVVDTDNGVSTSDLNTITPLIDTPHRLILRMKDSERDVVVKHNVGNIQTSNAQDVTLNIVRHSIELYYYDGLYRQVSEEAK